jgi:hypothetical protein
MKKRSNSAKGQTSYDREINGLTVAFANRNITPYPTEVGGPRFDLIPIRQQKDHMINTARMYAQQEYDRIMQLVTVLQQQADDIKRRLEVTDWVHAAEYNFQIYHGNSYWLAYDSRDEKTRLLTLSPQDWGDRIPEHYKYMCKVKYLGDHTWIEIKEENDVSK